MESVTPENFKPRETLAVMFLLGLLIALAWLWMYFGVFLGYSKVGGVVP